MHLSHRLPIGGRPAFGDPAADRRGHLLVQQRGVDAAEMGIEHAMVVEELDEEARRGGPHLRRVGKPHRGGLEDGQTLHEVARIAPLGQPLAQRRILLAAKQLTASRLKRRRSATIR